MTLWQVFDLGTFDSTRKDPHDACWNSFLLVFRLSMPTSIGTSHFHAQCLACCTTPLQATLPPIAHSNRSSMLPVLLFGTYTITWCWGCCRLHSVSIDPCLISYQETALGGTYLHFFIIINFLIVILTSPWKMYSWLPNLTHMGQPNWKIKIDLYIC